MSLIYLAGEDNETCNHTGNNPRITIKPGTTVNTNMVEADKPGEGSRLSSGSTQVVQAGVKSDDVPHIGIESIAL